MNVAILGAGNIACKMTEAINGLDDSVRAYAVASRDLEKAQRFREKWGFEKAYGSYEQMLSDPEVDLVYVATPHSFHLAHARRCIDFGKPVLLEKPMTVSADQARELFAYAEEKNVFITEAIWTRYMPSHKIIRQLLDSGVIGTPHMIMADLSYPISHVPRMTTPALAGGSLLDIGIYCLNFASMVFGDDIADIRGTCTYCDTGVDCQDSITLTYRDADLPAKRAGAVKPQGSFYAKAASALRGNQMEQRMYQATEAIERHTKRTAELLKGMGTGGTATFK